MCPELKVDQNPTQMAVCRQAIGNDKPNKGKENRVSSKQYVVDIFNSQQKLKKMLNAQGSKGYKDFRTKIINDPRAKQNQEMFKYCLTIKVRDDIVNHWITPTFPFASFASALHPSLEKAGFLNLNKKVARDC